MKDLHGNLAIVLMDSIGHCTVGTHLMEKKQAMVNCQRF